MVSIMLMTIDRYDTITKTIKHNLDKAGCKYELLVADNGSKDRRVIDYIKSLKPAVLLDHKENKGIAYTLNQLILRAKGNYILQMPNDTFQQENWVRTLKEHIDAVDNSGIVGVHTVEELYPPKTVNGKTIHEGKLIFGAKMFSRKVLDKIGYYREDYHPYGYEDSDYCLRADKAGFRNHYAGGLSARHDGHDWGRNTEYRKMKDESLKENGERFLKFKKLIEAGKELYIPKPEMSIYPNIACEATGSQ